jgi:hypothetical protein
MDEESQRFTLYLNKGATVKTALALAANEQVVITDIYVHVLANANVEIFDGPNETADAGERILLGSFAANTGYALTLNVPHYCRQGTYPKVVNDQAGQIDATIRGFIVKN